MSSGSVSDSSSRQIFWKLFGDALVSKNLWLLIAGVEIGLTFLSQIPGDVRKPPLNILAGVISSSVLLATLWLTWALVLRHVSGLVRVVVAIPIIVAAGVARGLALQWMLITWQMSAPGADGFRYRALASVLVVLLGSMVGALLKVGVDGHRIRLENLSSEQKRLALILDQAETQVQVNQDQAVARIHQTLVDQLASLKGASPLLAIDSLETLATDTVRPLSHRLAATTPTWQPPDLSRFRTSLDRSRVWGSITSFGFIEPLAPAAFVVLVAPASIAVAGLRAALIVHLVVAVLVYIGLWTLRTVAPTWGATRSLLVRLSITSAGLVVASLPAGVAAYYLSGPVSGTVNALYTVLVVPLVAMLWSFIRAARIQRQDLDAELTQVVDDTRWWVSRTRMVGWWQQTTIARALHGPVQTAIYAAAHRLRISVADGTATDELVQSTLNDVRSSLPDLVLESSGVDQLSVELQALTNTWRPLASVMLVAEAEAEQRMRHDPICREICMDIISEAVSNALRHGGAREVRGNIEAKSDNVISVAVVDDGSGWVSPALPEAQHLGLGSLQLEACALNWTHSRHGTSNLLAVELPLPLASDPQVS